MADWIVVVDDDVAVLKLTGQLLSKHNKRVTALKSGKALLEYVPNNTPDLILLDLNMPEMGGLEALSKLRFWEAENQRNSIPVLILTAEENPEISEDMESAGVCGILQKPFVPDNLIHCIDETLKAEKENAFERGSANGEEQLPAGLNDISRLLSEKSAVNSALLLDQDSFVHVYRFVMRYINRYHRNACQLLFTLSPNAEVSEEEFERYCDAFCTHVKKLLRKSDLVMQYRKDQIFIFLTDIKEDAIRQVTGNIMRTWGILNKDVLAITYEVEFMESDDLNHADEKQPWVVVCDDDITNLKLASHILAKSDMHVSTVESGNELLEFLLENRPNLILLDVRMPGMDGFETLQNIMAMEEDVADIPVIFLTASDDEESEKKGLALGAIDFVRKPFIPEVLVMRVRQVIEMVKLQRNLAKEVEKKTKENEELFIHVVESLADAIDAKDPYTKGHSGRVAEYSTEIAKRYGYNSKEQSYIYIMGLLHDVGKIGVPDTVITKKGSLTDDEYNAMKKHPEIGANILKNIKEMPELAIGARWHHERFDGSGYPDGFAGDEIPEAARIIAVADAYDAMTSFRSYRDALAQEKVRAEIERCSGTQFDPKFAKIMLEMIDEDIDYDMREKQDPASDFDS